MEVTKDTQSEIDDARDIDNLKRVEAALFVSGKFLSQEELVSLTDLNPILLNRSLSTLKEKYDEDSAIEIVNQDNLWKMDVRVEHHGIATRIASGSEEFTKAEQETLAIIAYKQPITQSKIVHVRGNKAYDHVKKFVDLGLVKSKRVGRTKELNLSNEFYDYFNVKDRNAFKSEDQVEVDGTD
jgi:segregation and condensation protein B